MSRYENTKSKTSQILRGKKEVKSYNIKSYGTTIYSSIPESDSDIYVITQFGDRLDQLAHQVSLENEDGSLLLENDSVSGDSNYFLLETYAIQTQSPYADNVDLDSEAGFDTASVGDDILDFTERNPFGEVDF